MKSTPKIDAICETCGNKFKTWAYVIRNGGGKYCRRKCMNVSTPKDKFFKYVIINQFGCWDWGGSITGSGYPRFSQGGRGSDKQVLAHRFSYEFYKGEIPKNLSVCHTCDNPKCCNPNHLFVGTTKDNSVDMVKKGRSLKGNRNPSVTRNECIPKGEDAYIAKLTNSQVIEIRERAESCYKLAKKYHVHPSTIKDIWGGRTWKSIH